MEELLARFGLPRQAGSQLQALLDLLAADPHAPTAVTDPGEALDVHVADSLVALELEVVRRACSIVDLGSGPGFPGLALAAAAPEARVVLVESVGRKCAFLERAIAAAGLENAGVVCARAEAWAGGGGAHDLVTARALAPLPVVVEYAAPLLRTGGALVAWKGRRDAREEADGEAAAAALGMERVSVAPVVPYPRARHRHLHVVRKVTPTPAGYPRRPGVAAKRPLGAG